MTATDRPWTVLVPLKRLDRSKSRLALPPALRRAVAEAMLLDVLAAAAPVARVCLVSAEPARDRYGVPVLPDPGGGLSAAVAHAAARFDGPVAVLSGDLPAARPAELAAALAAAAALDTAVLADAPGSGTTLLTARRGRWLRPAYGPDSHRRHVGAGMADLTGRLALPGLRRDVDTVADLREAARLGIGPASTGLLAAAGHTCVGSPWLAV
ncbi:2-phospho-L-lactate guanylyltransferase [Micromonospora sp. CNB394]|uniref:2-phospho-L-lactate guanylyltransferase n=1 Tax=Micromonospora sp. CNB394 TaxID=1169151 RepID=UPI00038141A6|nr:2-phospho-L-lactate guanylyltransferase [Micromonospora sp. CNB394]